MMIIAHLPLTTLRNSLTLTLLPLYLIFWAHTDVGNCSVKLALL